MAMNSQGTVYLLHFDPAYAHARHYLGWTAGDPARRVDEHTSGQGSPLVKAHVAAGGTVTVARTWEADRSFERRLKKHGKARVCPLCTDAPRSPTTEKTKKERHAHARIDRTGS